MKKELVSLLFAVAALAILLISFAANAQPHIFGQTYTGGIYICATEEDATEVVVAEISEGMATAMALFAEKGAEGKCVVGITTYTPLEVVTTVRNGTAVSYVVLLDIGGFQAFALSKIRPVPKGMTI